MSRFNFFVGVFALPLVFLLAGCETQQQATRSKSLALMQAADKTLYVVDCVKKTGIENTKSWQTNCKFDTATLKAVKAGSVAKERYSFYYWYAYYDYFYYYNLAYYTPRVACGLMGFYDTCYSFFNYTNYTYTNNTCDTCSLSGSCPSSCTVPVTTTPAPTPLPVVPTPPPAVQPPVQPAPPITPPQPTLVDALCVGGPYFPRYAFGVSDIGPANTCGLKVASYSNSCRHDLNIRPCKAWSDQINTDYSCVCAPNKPPVGNWN